MSHSNSTRADKSGDAPLDTKVLDTIGRALKAHYDDLVKAPLPDRLLDLLARLEAKEREAEPQGEADASD